MTEKTIKLADQLWAQAQPRAYQCLYHPFVTQLAAGTLRKENFQAFLLQDAYFLNAFAKAFAYAVTKAKEPKHVLALIRLMGGIETELSTHNAFLESFGIDVFQVQDASAAPATRNYVNFLLDTAKHSTSVAEILAAMTPCMRLYAFIGKTISVVRKGMDDSSHPYQRWINSYCTDEFEAAAVVTEDLLNDVAATENAKLNLTERYNRAMELELCFFDEFLSYQRAHSSAEFPTWNFPMTIRLDINAEQKFGSKFSPIKAVVDTLANETAMDAAELEKLWSLKPGSYEIHLNVTPEKKHTIAVVTVQDEGYSSSNHYPLLKNLMVATTLRHSPLKSPVMKIHSTHELVAFLKTMAAGSSFLTNVSPFLQQPAAVSHRIPRVLTIAGSDSGGGAGIQADLKACTNLGVFSSSALTAVTVQNTKGVHGIHVIPINEITDQITCVLDDIGADVVKTGMLFNEEIIEKVALLLKDRQLPLVLDPVMVATSGDRLLKAAAHKKLVTMLFPLATIITPNIPEASAFLHDRKIETVEHMKAAAKELSLLGPRFVLVKGGHLEDSDLVDGNVKDVLYDAEADKYHVIINKKLHTQNTHGTGCTLAAAIAAQLAKKPDDVVFAVRTAIEYLHQLLHESQALDIGKGDSKPMLHVF